MNAQHSGTPLLEPAPVAPPRPRGLDRATRRGVAVLCSVLFVVYGTYAWVRHQRFVTTAFDLGIFDQLTRQYARFEAPIVPLKAPGYNLLGDHFHPLTVLWAPLYWVWDDPRMLLLAQAALVSVSVVPVVRFTARRWPGWRALLVGAVYGLSWPLQRMIQFDVHEIAFAVPLIAVAIDAMDRRAHRWTFAACAALLLVREDMGVFVAIVGVLVALRRPDDAAASAGAGADAGDVAGGGAVAADGRRRSLAAGGALVVLGAAGYKLATGVVIPHFSSGVGFVYWTFPALGPDPASAAKFVLRHPWETLQLMVTPWLKAHTLLMLGLPTLYLCLFSPYVLLAAPFIAQRMLNSRVPLWTTNYHYSSVLAPIAIMAAVDSLHRVLAWYARRGTSVGGARVRAGVRDVWLVWAVGVIVVGMATQAGDYPVSRIWTHQFWAKDARIRATEATLPLIPRDVCIEAENNIAPQLTDTAYVTRVDRSDDLATWMVLDLSRAITGWEGTKPAVAYARALERGFEVVAKNGSIVLLNRPNAPIDPVCQVTG